MENCTVYFLAVRLDLVEVAFLSPHGVGLGLVAISLAMLLANGGTCLPDAVEVRSLGLSLGQSSGTLVVVLVVWLVLPSSVCIDVSFSAVNTTLADAWEFSCSGGWSEGFRGENSHYIAPLTESESQT